jgi:hypothetical protein
METGAIGIKFFVHLVISSYVVRGNTGLTPVLLSGNLDYIPRGVVVLSFPRSISPV